MITQIIDNGELVCQHLPTHLMIADIGIKPLLPQPFIALRDYQLGYSTLPQVLTQLNTSVGTVISEPCSTFPCPYAVICQYSTLSWQIKECVGGAG